MNAYTFVTKQNKQPQHQTKIGSSILQRLQQLKQSMRPSQPIQQQYQSTVTNKNFGLNLSNIQNQRLKQYLPNQGYSKIKTHNQEGFEQFESYRKSLQKKLNYLFQKQKNIMKTQSTYQPSKYNLNQQFKFQEKINYDDELERKYHQFKAQQMDNHLKQQVNPFFGRQTRSFSNLNRHINQVQRQPFEHREHKAFSTIQHVGFMKSQGSKQRKDQEIQQMQRKIKILEMKYLGSTSSQHHKHDQRQQNHINIQEKKNLGNQNLRQYRSKSIKSKHKKYGTSPDNMKTKTKNQNKQTIEGNYLPQNEQRQSNKKIYTKQSNIRPLKESQIIHQKGKRKQRIKEYMNTIDNKCQQEQNLNQKQYLLHQQFNSLKIQFQTLLKINKSIIEKVQTNQEEKTRKKQSKQKAKAMLKEILYRLEQIRYEIKNKTENRDQYMDQNQKIKQTIKPGSQKKKPFDEVKSDSKKNVGIFQKSYNINNPKLTLKDIGTQNKLIKIAQQKNLDKCQSLKKILNRQDCSLDDVDKLKVLLNLQIQHRNIIQKKLQVIYGNNKPITQ